MTSKERVLKTISFEKSDRVPFNFWMDRRLMDRYEQELGEDWRVKVFDADIVETFFGLAFPTGEIVEESGTGWLKEALSWDEIEKLDMPDPTDDSAYDIIRRDVAKHADRAVIADAPGVLTIAHNLRSYDYLLMDVYDNPEQVKSLFGRITDVMVEACDRACQIGITALYVMDDIAYANGPMMSMDMLEEFVFSYNTQLINVAKKHDVPVFLHCCGNVTDLVPTFIKQGVDVLNPLQPHLHDINNFREKHGDKIAIYGALDNTHIIPHGSPDEVREHVFSSFEALGKNGGLIFSTHDIPLDTPRENIEAMIDAIKECKY